ncbi:uncharacterized protein LOC125592437 [Brassica napus]|uniref:uncharacterized protein LOC125592437 n=1 Tax=Brassica napus TaxID=3708 RepID=UPI00207A8D9A|nr:uncharacterized protein LOC125592437 [Brassica napus]
MDPSNVPSKSASYVGLLHSQQGSVYHENFPYGSFHSSVNFAESDTFPAFSSQQSEDAPVDAQAARPVRRKWTPTDDEVLISGWLNTSKDSIVANEQRSGAFWIRVGKYYAESVHGREDGVREHGCCKKRWHRINDDVNKFCDAYSAAQRQISSGESDTDVLKKAHEIFFSDQEHKFTLEHAWCVLRPEGVRAAKAKRNTGKGKSVAEIATVWEMKKDDLVRKERLSKLAILDTLFTKPVPLTERGESAKNKLLAELF